MCGLISFLYMWTSSFPRIICYLFSILCFWLFFFWLLNNRLVVVKSFCKFRSSVPSLTCMYVFISEQYSIRALQCTLRNGMVVPPTFFSLLGTVRLSGGLLWFHMNFRIIFLSFKEWNGGFDQDWSSYFRDRISLYNQAHLKLLILPLQSP